MEKRFVDLELRYMKLEQLVEELSGVVASQQRALDAATAEIKRLADRLRDLGEDHGDAADERPPHY
ncbi:hypothetical protein BH09MYX1_BH09MYX1_25120 [soil metagenome]